MQTFHNLALVYYAIGDFRRTAELLGRERGGGRAGMQPPGACPRWNTRGMASARSLLDQAWSSLSVTEQPWICAVDHAKATGRPAHGPPVPGLLCVCTFSRPGLSARLYSHLCSASRLSSFAEAQWPWWSRLWTCLCTTHETGTWQGGSPPAVAPVCGEESSASAVSTTGALWRPCTSRSPRLPSLSRDL